jgi:pimeloyl-ACP methyl ester carboxylesterase
VLAALAAIAAAAYANVYATAPGIYDFPDVMQHVRAGGFYNYHGHAIFYRTSYGGVVHSSSVGGAPQPGGLKPVLVLLHGFPTSSFDWAHVWAPLAQEFDLVALDFLGYGLSDKPTRYAYLLSEQASIVEALLRGLGVRAYHLLAHDYGVSVAQELLARRVEDRRGGSSAHSGRITTQPAGTAEVEAEAEEAGAGDATPRPRLLSVAFLNGGLIPEGHRPLLMQRLLVDRFVGPLLKRFALSPWFFVRSLNRVLGERHQLSAEEGARHAALTCHKDGYYVMDKLLDYMAQRRAHRRRWLGALFDADVPCQLIFGPADPVSGAHMVQAYAEEAGRRAAAPGGWQAGGAGAGGVHPPHGSFEADVAAARARDGVLTLPADVGHYPQLEAPGAVVDAVRAFHAKLGKLHVQ